MASGTGTLAASPAAVERTLDDYVRLGVRWLRMDLNWAEIQAEGRDRWDWSDEDRVIDGARKRGIAVVASLAYTPAWARPPGTDDKRPPDDLSDYARFVREAVARYAPRGVTHWEVWNEPNLAQFWKPRPDAAAYARLLRAAYEAAKEADPDAFVVVGGLAPARSDGTHVAPVEYLRELYANGANGSFDALGFHPYTRPDFPTHPRPNAPANPWHQTAGTDPSLRSLMEENGDGAKQIWATEFGAPTAGGAFAVSEEEQAQMVTEAYRLWSSYPWAGPLFWYSYRDRPAAATWADFCGLVRVDFEPKPAYDAFRELALSAR